MNLNKYSWQRTCISWSERKRSICRVISWTRMNGHSQGCDSNRSSRGEKKKIETFGTNDGMKKNRNLFIYFFHLPPSWMEDLFEPPIPISKIERSSWSTICTEGYRNRRCSKSTIDGIVRTVKWWIAVGVKSWRELVLTETRIRTQKATRVGEIPFSHHVWWYRNFGTRLIKSCTIGRVSNLRNCYVIHA